MPALILLALVVSAMRFAGFHGAAFQAGAHLLVGGLFGVGFYAGWRAGRWHFALALALTVVEVVAFFSLR